MMSLFFSECSHPVDKLQRLLEVGKGEGASDVVLLDHAPLGNLLVQRLELFALERRHAAGAGNAFLVRQLFGHGENILLACKSAKRQSKLSRSRAP